MQSTSIECACGEDPAWSHWIQNQLTSKPAHLQRDYAAILLQVGDVLPAQSFPNMWEAAMTIMIGKYKQGELWIEGQGHALTMPRSLSP